MPRALAGSEAGNETLASSIPSLDTISVSAQATQRYGDTLATERGFSLDNYMYTTAFIICSLGRETAPTTRDLEVAISQCCPCCGRSLLQSSVDVIFLVHMFIVGAMSSICPDAKLLSHAHGARHS